MTNVQELAEEIQKYNEESQKSMSDNNIYQTPKKCYKRKIARIHSCAEKIYQVLSGFDTDQLSMAKKADPSIMWETPEDIWSFNFRSRYIILVIQEVVVKMNIIAANELRRKRITDDIFENAYFESDHIFNTIIKYMFLVLDEEKSFTNTGLKTHLILEDTKSHGYSEKYYTMVKNGIETLKDGLKHGWFTPKEIPDDIAIDTIIKVSYMLATGSKKFGDLPNFKRIEGMTIEDDSSELLRILGRAILMKTKNEKISVGFKLFEKSNPKCVVNTSRCITNDELVIKGFRAVLYLKFILSDGYASEFIDKFLG